MSTISKAEWDKQIEDYLLEDRRQVGKVSVPDPMVRDLHSFPLAHSLVTEESIRDCAMATGNPDPLYNDASYGKRTRWGSMVAPPGPFIRYIANPASFPNPLQAPGISRFYGGTSYTYYGVIRPGDVFHVVDRYLGYTEKMTKDKPYRLFTVTDERSYINQRDETVCVAVGHEIVTATWPGKGESATGTSFLRKQRRHYTKEELDVIHRHYDDELEGRHRRGADVRYWEDVHEGEELPTLIKGPLDVIDCVSFAASGFNYGAFAVKWDFIRSSLSSTLTDPETGEYQHVATWHFLDSVAKEAGLPYALALGAQDQANIAHLVCNWKGDDGFVKRLNIQHRGMDFLGDVSYVRGKVLSKYVEGDEHLVDLDLWSETQDGLKHTVGRASVRLISQRG